MLSSIGVRTFALANESGGTSNPCPAAKLDRRNEQIKGMTNPVFPKDWLDSIQKSGKFFEQEIATLVHESGFGWVIPNYAYLDVEEGKSREMDVYAMAGKRIGRKWNFIFPILLISVSDKPLVCFTRKDWISPYTTAGIQISGMPRNVFTKKGNLEIAEFLKIEKLHHYYKRDKISSQFWSPLERKDTNGDYFYRELLLPLIKSIVAEKKEHEKGWYFDPTGEPINLQLYYPIIVVNDLWECFMTGDKVSYSKTRSLGFLFHTASESYSGDYMVDICTKEGLVDIIKSIDLETDKIVAGIKKNRVLLEKSALQDAKARSKKKSR